MERAPRGEEPPNHCFTRNVRFRRSRQIRRHGRDRGPQRAGQGHGHGRSAQAQPQEPIREPKIIARIAPHRFIARAHFRRSKTDRQAKQAGGDACAPRALRAASAPMAALPVLQSRAKTRRDGTARTTTPQTTSGASDGNVPGRAVDGGVGSANFQFAAPAVVIGRARHRSVDAPQLQLPRLAQSRLGDHLRHRPRLDSRAGRLGFGKIVMAGDTYMLIDGDGTRHPYEGTLRGNFPAPATSLQTFEAHTTDGSFINYYAEGYKPQFDNSGGRNMIMAWAVMPNGTKHRVRRTGQLRHVPDQDHRRPRQFHQHHLSQQRGAADPDDHGHARPLRSVSLRRVRIVDGDHRPGTRRRLPRGRAVAISMADAQQRRPQFWVRGRADDEGAAEHDPRDQGDLLSGDGHRVLVRRRRFLFAIRDDPQGERTPGHDLRQCAARSAGQYRRGDDVAGDGLQLSAVRRLLQRHADLHADDRGLGRARHCLGAGDPVFGGRQRRDSDDHDHAS